MLRLVTPLLSLITKQRKRVKKKKQTLPTKEQQEKCIVACFYDFDNTNPIQCCIDESLRERHTRLWDRVLLYSLKQLQNKRAWVRGSVGATGNHIQTAATNQKQIQTETGNNAGRPSDLRSEELCYYEPKTMAWAEIKSVFTWVLMRSAI